MAVLRKQRRRECLRYVIRAGLGCVLRRSARRSVSDASLVYVCIKHDLQCRRCLRACTDEMRMSTLCVVWLTKLPPQGIMPFSVHANS